MDPPQTGLAAARVARAGGAARSARGDLARAQLDEYAGTYMLADQLIAIARDGDAIAASRNGGAPQKLSCELRDVFFTPGRPRSRRIFQRDAGGRVAGFTDRREGEDIVWMRRD